MVFNQLAHFNHLQLWIKAKYNLQHTRRKKSYTNNISKKSTFLFMDFFISSIGFMADIY